MTQTPELRVLLEQQAALLAPISARLHAASAHPPIAPIDWHGPAADAYTQLESRLRSRIVSGEEAVDAALRDTRVALGELDG